MAQILIIGAADTGRAPMAAALLRRLLETKELPHMVASAGVLGHDGDPATEAAQQIMEQMSLTIADHTARSVSDELLDEAGLLVAIDSGTLRVLQARFPQAETRSYTLGALAGRQRDIPDPFKMQIGAWLTYAQEIETLLQRALPRMLELLGDTTKQQAQGSEIPSSDVVTNGRRAAVERMLGLLQVVAQMPGVIDWNGARSQLLTDLEQTQTPASGSDLVIAFGGLLRAALSMTPATPTPGQLAALRDVVALLAAPVEQQAVNDFSGRLGSWTTL